MKVFSILFLSVIALASTETIENEKSIINEKFYPDERVVYHSNHDIVKILLPLNSHPIKNPSPKTKEDEVGLAIFFVEATINKTETTAKDTQNKRTGQGLYVFKNNKAIKLLSNGRDAAAPGDRSNLIFFGASDGIYIYNEEKETADKYGTVNDDIINIEKEVIGEVIYILTANKEVYKVTKEGTVKTKIDVTADQIVLDYSNNMYFTRDQKLYIHTKEGVKEVNVPENSSSVTLIRPPYTMNEGITCIIDNAIYLIYPNGTSEEANVKFDPNYKPTAISMEAAIPQYYALDKKIYKYHLNRIPKMEEFDNLKKSGKRTLQFFFSEILK